MRLILAEKPDMGKNIAQALGVKKSNTGYLELTNGDIVTWAIGHLIRLKTPDAYPEYKTWKLDTLPIIPAQMEFEADPSKKGQLQVIKGLLQRATCVVIATDPGREGEWIARTVLNYCSYRGALKRLWINDLTPETIRRGFEELLEGDQTYLLGEAARIRAYADYWMGFTATRFFTLKATEVTKEKVLLSAGRVQTPTLRIVYDREMAIEKFESKPFYTLECEFKSKEGSYIGKWYKDTAQGIQTRFDDKKSVEELIQQIRKNSEAKVLKYESKQVKRQSPQLLHLTALQEQARKKLGFSLQKSLKILQSIYDKECCSYPRTSSRHLSKNKAEELQRDLQLLKEKGQYQKYFPDNLRSLQEIKRYVDDSKAIEHHAIVPTHESPFSKKGTDKELTPDEEALYELILVHTLAAFHPEGVDQQVEINTEAAGETFYTKANSIVTMGWRTILKPDSEEEKDDIQAIKGSLPQLLVGDSVNRGETKINTGKTTPPKRLADTDIVKAMEHAGQIVDEANVDSDVLQELKEKGLGTPATRTGIIDELLGREYIEVKKSLVYLTPKGRHFMEIVYNHPISSIELTGEFEKKLGMVSDGKCSADHLLEEFKSFTFSIIEMGSKVQEKLVNMMGDKPIFSQVTAVGSCPFCNKPVIERKGFYGCSGYKDGCKFTLSGSFMKGKVTLKMAKDLLANKEVPIKLTGQYGEYQLLLFLKEGKLDSRKPTLQDNSIGACPCCGKEVVDKAKLYGCSGYKDGCKFSIPKEFLGKNISATQAKKLLKNGKTDVIKGFTGKNKEFDAALKYDKQENRLRFAF